MADLDGEQIDKEILPFLSTKARPDVRYTAMQYFTGLTGTDAGCEFIASNNKYLTAIIDLAEDQSQPAITKDALFALINLTTHAHIAQKIATLPSKPDFILELLKWVLKPDFKYADIVSSILANMSRDEDCAKLIVKQILANQDAVGFDKIITAFCTIDYNKENKLHYLGSFLSNLTQIPDTRQYILDKKRCVIQRLLPFTEFQDSPVRRAGVIATLYNCSFETEYHEWLLGEEVDILPRLLLPLAGSEDIEEEDMEKLPLDLQYLEPDKTRESDASVRKILLDTLFQLCALKNCLDFIKGKNAYVILQKLHLWETDPSARLACENVVNLLIADDLPTDNLHEVEIPSDMKNQLDKGYAQIVKEIQEETEQLSVQSDTQDKNDKEKTNTVESNEGRSMDTQNKSAGQCTDASECFEKNTEQSQGT